MNDQPEAPSRTQPVPPLTPEECTKVMQFIANEFGTRVAIVVLAGKFDVAGNGTGIAFLSNVPPDSGMRMIHAIAEAKK